MTLAPEGGPALRRFVLPCALAASLAAAAPAFAAEDAHSHGHAAEEAKLVLDHGKKWPTDAPLRQGMENIRAVVAKGAKDEALAKAVETEVAGIVQNCKLEPEADEQLHIVIAELMAGAEAKDAERVAKALNAYGEHFDHAGWKRL